MNSDSIRLAWAGAAIGVLVLSAVVFADARPPAQQGESGMVPASAAAAATMDFEAEAVAVLAPETEVGRAFEVILRAEDPAPGERLFLCDEAGCPLEEIEADAYGESVLGPIAPGRYGLWRGETEIGSFRLLNDAVLTEAEGRLWTDGKYLFLERFETGTARLTLILSRPGYASFQLCDQDGRSRSGDLYVPQSALPDRDRCYVRVLEFRGLAPGLYTLIRERIPLAQFPVRAGETAEAELRIEK